MSIEATNGIVQPEFKGADTEFWDDTTGLPVTDETDAVVVLREPAPNFAELLPPQTPKPNPVDYIKRQKPKPNRRPQEDPDKYLLQAKALVVQNYNEHRDPRRSPMLTMDLVYITTFTKTLHNWKATIGSTVVRGLLWEVTFNGEQNEDGEKNNEAYIDIFKKLGHVKILLG